MKKLLKPIENKRKSLKDKVKQLVQGITKKRRVLMFLLLPFVALGVWFLYNKNHTKTTYAADPLVVTYEGSGPPAPMFNITGMIPGDEVVKTFNVRNDDGPAAVTVKIDGLKVNETNSYAGILDVEITDLGSTTYFNGKLQGFFDAPLITLGPLAPNADKNFRVKVKFPLSAGNEYQDAMVTFNIMWLAETGPTPPPGPTDTPTPGAIVLPAECSSLQGKITKVVEGTDGDDNINATNDSELILAKNGNDRISGLGGDDCIVGGQGADRIRGGQGNDIILGNEGNDDIDGNDDNDTIYGGSGDDEVDGGANNDKIYGGTGKDDIDGSVGDDYIEGNENDDTLNGGPGNDTIYGNDGDDDIEGSEGNDVIYGGNGNDNIEGESGLDQLFGEAGDDEIEGGSQNDTLNGGANTDSLDGDSGTDTCTEGEILSSCEL